MKIGGIYGEQMVVLYGFMLKTWWFYGGFTMKHDEFHGGFDMSKLIFNNMP